MIELIPIAQGFPEELFDKMYIDETVVTDVKNLNNCIYNLLGQQGYQSASMTDPTISEYYNGRYTVVNPSHPNCRLYIEIGGERGDVFNVHEIDANKKEAILWKTRTLTGDDGSTDIVATLTNDVYQTIQESSNKEILLPLVKHFFRITAPAINNYHDSKEVYVVSN